MSVGALSPDKARDDGAAARKGKDVRDGRARSPEAGARRKRRLGRWLARLAPVIAGLLALALWEGLVRYQDIPRYLLPAPSEVLVTLWQDRDILGPAFLVTLEITGAALLAAAVGGILLAILFTLQPWLERTLFPYAIVLQVTPVVAIAPLILVYVDQPFTALLICAWLVAFFPVLANTALGLKSHDHNLAALFTLYGASRWQRLLHLQLPSALPYILAGLRIAGGLALIGAVVAEFVAGTAGARSGLAYRILEAGYRLEIPRMFASLLLLSLTGVAIFFGLGAIGQRLLGRWHESARPPER